MNTCEKVKTCPKITSIMDRDCEPEQYQQMIRAACGNCTEVRVWKLSDLFNHGDPFWVELRRILSGGNRQ